MTYKHVHHVEFHLDDGLIWDGDDYEAFKADLTSWLASYGEVSDLQAEADKIPWGGPAFDRAMRTKAPCLFPLKDGRRCAECAACQGAYQ